MAPNQRSVPAWVVPSFASLLTALVAGGAAYVAFGHDKVTRSEYREDLRSIGPPWREDKPVVEHRLEVLTRAQEQLTESVQRLGVDTARVVQRLDDFLKAQDR